MAEDGGGVEGCKEGISCLIPNLHHIPKDNPSTVGKGKHISLSAETIKYFLQCRINVTFSIKLSVLAKHGVTASAWKASPSREKLRFQTRTAAFSNTLQHASGSCSPQALMVCSTPLGIPVSRRRPQLYGGFPTADVSHQPAPFGQQTQTFVITYYICWSEKQQEGSPHKSELISDFFFRRNGTFVPSAARVACFIAIQSYMFLQRLTAVDSFTRTT